MSWTVAKVLEAYDALFSSLQGLDEQEMMLHADFRRKVTELGSARATKDPAACRNIDATAFLTEEEYRELTEEFKRLPGAPC